MQSMVLITLLVATLIFGFFVARAFGRFLDENQTPGEQECTDENDCEASYTE